MWQIFFSISGKNIRNQCMYEAVLKPKRIIPSIGAKLWIVTKKIHVLMKQFEAWVAFQPSLKTVSVGYCLDCASDLSRQYSLEK